jgi:Fe-S cluster assembly protein SufD
LAAEAIQAWTETLRATALRLNATNDGLDERRQEALQRFQSHGFPSRKNEEWRYTPLKALASGPCHALLPASQQVPAQQDLPLEVIARVVLVNGHFQEELSDLSGLPAGIKITTLSSLRQDDSTHIAELLNSSFPAEEHPFQSLSDAMLDDGIFIEVSDGQCEVEATIHILHAFDGSAGAGSAHVTGVVRSAAGTALRLVEEVRSSGEVLGNIRWAMSLDKGATVNRVRVFRPGCDSIFHGTRVVQEKESQFHDLMACTGCNLVRNELHAIHAGPGCHVDLLGAYVANGREVVDNHTTIDHAVEDCTSREIYRGVLSGKGRGVFTGMIHVHQDAQRTDAKQSNDTILLSRDAEMDSRPRLEIYADDVKCTHGATVGELDDEALFYLRSRGIQLDEARRMLVRAFASEVLSDLESDDLREFLIEELQQSIPRNEECSS